MHYGWVVVAAAILIITINSSISFLFGILLIPLSEDMGWSRGQLSLGYALEAVSHALFAVPAGWFTDRWGVRRVLVAGGGLLLLGLVLAGRVTELWQFYLTFGLLLGAGRGSFWTPLFTIGGLWFTKRIGLAIGLLSSGVGLGPLLFTPLYRYLVDLVGWRQALTLIGIGSGIIILALSLLIYSRPEDVGLKPYGTPSRGASGEEAPRFRPGVLYKGSEGSFFQFARKTQPFLLMPLIHFFSCINHTIPMAHMVAMAEDVGMASMAAAGVVSLMTGISLASRIGNGILSEARGGKMAMVLALAFQGPGVLILLGAKEMGSFYLFALVFGLGFGGQSVPFPILLRQYYGSAPIGVIMGIIDLVSGLGMAVGGYAAGALFDLTGNYTSAIWISALAGLLGMVLTLRLVSPKPRLVLEAVPPPSH